MLGRVRSRMLPCSLQAKRELHLMYLVFPCTVNNYSMVVPQAVGWHPGRGERAGEDGSVVGIGRAGGVGDVLAGAFFVPDGFGELPLDLVGPRDVAGLRGAVVVVAVEHGEDGARLARPDFLGYLLAHDDPFLSKHGFVARGHGLVRFGPMILDLERNLNRPTDGAPGLLPVGVVIAEGGCRA